MAGLGEKGALLRCWACSLEPHPHARPTHSHAPFPQTTKAHITVLGGVVEELVADAGLVVTSSNPFKGDMDCQKLAQCIEK